MAAVTEICLSLSLSFHPQLFNKQALLCSVELGSIQCTNRNRHLHISKILFLLSVSFTIEYRVGIAELYLYMGLLVLICRKCAHQSLKTAEMGIRTPLKSANCIRFLSQIGVHAPTFLSRLQNFVKIGKEFWIVNSG